MSYSAKAKFCEEVVLVLFTYNQENYIDRTLPTIFAQTLLPSKLIILDDHSTDNTDSELRRVIKTAPQGLVIDYQRNEKNIGLAAQWNKLVGQFQNKLIIVQAGDDEAFPNRVEDTYGAWLQNGRPSLVLANYDGIDQSGKTIQAFSPESAPQKKYDLERLISRRAMVFGCCAAVSSELINEFRDIPLNVINEDRINAFRAYFLNGIYYIHKPLLRYTLTGGISSLDQLGALEKNRVNAQRELADLACHELDAKHISAPNKVLRLIHKRRIFLLWKAGLKNKPSFIELLYMSLKVGSFSWVFKVAKHLK